MTSSINPNNIDSAYPVAGQDNDSQGFRDNFTNIKTNFSYAQDEIEDLQNNVIVKSALEGTTLDNDMGGNLIQSPKFVDVREEWNNLGLQAGNVAISIGAAPFHTLTTTAPITLDFTNIPASGDYVRWRVLIDVAQDTHTITLPASVTVGLNGINGLSGQIINPIHPAAQGAGKYMFEFSTYDGGSSIIIVPLIQ